MPPISLILLHGRVWPKAVAIAAGRIVAAGSNAEIAALAGPETLALDCHGLTIHPGFIDAHCHILAAARDSSRLDCSLGSIAEIVAAIRAEVGAIPPEGWLRGRGYHEMTLKERRHPTRRDLDPASPDVPVRITHVTGHASVLNSAALTRLGIDSSTEEPPGGVIERESETGEPSGVLIEMEDWLDRRMPRHGSAALEEDIRRFSERLLAAGVTSVQDLGHRNDRRRAELLADFAARRLFRPRITMATGYEAFAAGEEAAAPGIARGPVKIMINESGDALEPNAQNLTRMVDGVHRAGRQAAIHAISSAAITASLYAIGAAQSADGRIGRHRIEHAAVASTPLIEHMANLGAVPVSNPAFIYEHGDRYLQTVPEDQLPCLYDAAGIVRNGRRIAAGSDAPVGPIEPSRGIWAACRRLTKSGRSIPSRSSPLSMAWGLLMYSLGGAFAAFEELQKGLIAPGMLADLVLLDIQRDWVHPMMTILGGEIVWRAPTWESVMTAPEMDMHAR
jgi:predicted amidohydrolase YtcJ